MENIEDSTEHKKSATIKERFYTYFRKNSKTEKRTGSSISLENYLLRAIEDKKLLPEKFPTSFDLGEFGKKSDEILKATLSDPKHHEYASQVAIDMDGKIVFYGLKKGKETQVAPCDQVPGEDRLLMIHSHPIDVPFSPEDLDMLFLQPNSKGWIMPAEILITPSLKMLIIRTEKTPVLFKGEQWRPKMEMYEEPVLEEKLIFQEPDISTENLSELALVSHKRMFALIKVAQKYNLKVYSCPIDQNIAYLAN